MSSYYIYHNPEDDFVPVRVDESKDVWDGYTCTEVKVNEEHHFIAYCFYNDMDDYADTDKHYPFVANSIQHIDYYLASNDSGGHFQVTHIEEYKDGDLIQSIPCTDELNDWTDEGLALFIDTPAHSAL